RRRRKRIGGAGVLLYIRRRGRFIVGDLEPGLRQAEIDQRGDRKRAQQNPQPGLGAPPEVEGMLNGHRRPLSLAPAVPMAAARPTRRFPPYPAGRTPGLPQPIRGLRSVERLTPLWPSPGVVAGSYRSRTSAPPAPAP